jgi:hypothetical protein
MGWDGMGIWQVKLGKDRAFLSTVCLAGRYPSDCAIDLSDPSLQAMPHIVLNSSDSLMHNKFNNSRLEHVTPTRVVVMFLRDERCYIGTPILPRQPSEVTVLTKHFALQALSAAQGVDPDYADDSRLGALG